MAVYVDNGNIGVFLSGEVFEYKSANKEADARSDIKCCGFWGNKRQAYFYVKGLTFARGGSQRVESRKL